MKSMSVYTCHNANNLNYLIVFTRFNFLYDVSSDINNEIVDFSEESVIDTNKKRKKNQQKIVSIRQKTNFLRHIHIFIISQIFTKINNNR